MCRPTIKCSRCGKLFCHGSDYRIHFDIHMNEWNDTKNKQEYIKKTTQWEE